MNNSKYKRLLGALKSKHPAAYLGIGIKAIAPVTQLIDLTCSRFLRIEPSINLSDLKCIFIVCPPRSGGTVIFQSLSRSLPCIYISNIHALFPKLGSKMLRNMLKTKKRKSFKNYYGYTPSLFDVYEGNEFFEWFHKFQSDMDEETEKLWRNKFFKIIRSIAMSNDKCVILKNARAFPIIEKLHKSIPEIIFVRVKRNRNKVIESVVRAYYDLGYFHPIPQSLKGQKVYDPIKYACNQIEAIEGELDIQFSNIQPKSKLEIRYEDFCDEPYDIVHKLAYDYLNLSGDNILDVSALKNLSASNENRVSESDRKRIHSIINSKNY